MVVRGYRPRTRDGARTYNSLRFVPIRCGQPIPVANYGCPMRTAALIAVLALTPGFAGAGQVPCLLSPAELAPVLGHTPLAGRSERDPLGNPMCIYDRADQLGHRFLLRLERQPWDRKRYDHRLTLARGSGIREAVMLANVGDSAFYVEGAAGALSGTRYVEISGFKAAAKKPVQPEEAATLLRLILERLPR